MNRGAIVAAIETNFCEHAWSLRELPGADVYEDEYVRWAITGVDYAPFNQVVRCVIPIDSADRIVSETLARFRARDVPMIWIVTSSSEPVDLAQRLEARGFISPARVPGMVLDLTLLREPPLFADAEIRPVRGETALDDFMDVFEKGFGLPEPAIAAFAQVFRRRDPSQYRHYVAYERGRPCSISSSYSAGGVVGIYNVTTLPETRRRGHACAVTFAALNDARAQGCHLGILGSSKESYSVYQRMGFEEYCSLGIYSTASVNE